MMPGRITVTLAGALLMVTCASDAVRTDDWDRAAETDSGVFTDNALRHGAEQVHAMAAAGGGADQDWYIAVNHPFSSYQVVVDGISPRLRPTLALQRVNAAGTGTLQVATAVEAGRALSLQWSNGASGVDNFVRVLDAECGVGCLLQDTYRIRFYDTTYTLPRFNNSGTQSTVLLIQNATAAACAVTHHYFSASGTLLASSPVATLPPRGLQVVPTADLLPGQSGSVRVAHDCGYGGLSGKAVALEPATGFTFDTPLVARPN
jgi:hypothetical protein